MRLRGRLALALVGVALIAAVLTASGAALLSVRSARERALDNLARQAELVASTLGRGGGPTGPERRFILRDGRATRVGPRSAVAEALAAAPGDRARGRVPSRGRELLFVRRRSADAAPVLIARGAGASDPDLAPVGSAFVLAALAAALLAGATALLIAGRLARPLRRLGAAARALGADPAGPPAGAALEADLRRTDEIGDLARAFAAMQDDLATARTAQRQFLRSVSHELKTPLAALRAQGEALEDGALDGASAGPVVVREAARLERLVVDLLALGSLDRPGFRVEDEALDLAAIAEAVRERHAARAAALDVRLTRSGAGAARGDRDRLEQALSNLVENALRVTPAGGAVTLAVTPGAVSVTDTGPGLLDEDLPRAFERFYLHDRYAPPGSGTGLGLALVAELTRAMGGTVSAEHAPGGGARFTLRLTQR
ncbi:two-component system sensor histidine kinase BaeS [Solirubrobacter pauli]|uniref:histidine kinase n=1 Tax=Solirubrobacter pauli TaxID=166793 RepID=A0A660L7Y7_9ACTN|nr:HAMP domain-containing sensor histidine kinase [Solirubrobacter pauli]RKQ91142.1 two-component system sensor histidine kinase BaeS [Solirubrobacter pauli]